MRRLQALHWVLTAVLLVGWAMVGVLCATGALEVRWGHKGRGGDPAEPLQRPDGEQATVPEGLDGKAPFFHERHDRPRANRSYPAWFRGTGLNGWADERSRYSFTQLVGPTSRLRANGLLMGTLALRPETTYPAHKHPAAEIYYILEGEADWYVDGVMRKVVPGTVILHKPNAVHGWKTTSAKELKAVWVWWAESEVVPAVLNQKAQLTDPDLAAEEATALPFTGPPLPDKRP